ncbi:Chromatin modification- protein meaf6 [Gonapodya sp. JEL0774]|nr:Chromatin modification- protein meaf6 [Gonapodya sp. JEL0774]
MTEKPPSEAPAPPSSTTPATPASADHPMKEEPTNEPSAQVTADTRDKGKEPADSSAGVAVGGDSEDATPEKLREAEAHLQELMQRKRQTERSLANLENQIYKFETSYLEDTGAIGNIVKGFEGYVNMSRGASSRQKQRVAETDRVFSRSSTTYEQPLKQNDSALFPHTNQSIAHIREKEARHEQQQQLKKHRLSSETPAMGASMASSSTVLSAMQQQQMMSPNHKKKKKRWSGADEDYR